jgi:hypothetical protein
MLIRNSYWKYISSIFNIYDKLQSNSENNFFRPNIEYSEDNIMDQDFKVIFRQPIRRF